MKRILYLFLLLSNLSSSQEIKILSGTNTIEIGDPITLEIRAEFNNLEKFSWPDTSKLKEDEFLDRENKIVIIEVDQIKEIIEPNTKIISQKIKITSFEHGNHLIPAFIFNSDSTRKTDSIIITVNKQTFKEEVIHKVIGCVDSTAMNYNPLANKDDKSCKYKIINEYNLYSKIYRNLIMLETNYILLVIILTLILIFLIYFFYRIKNPKTLEKEKIIIAADKIALRKLKEIQKSNLLSQEKTKEYHSQISLIIREYLGSRFRFYALEMPSKDILTKLENIKLDGKDIQKANTILSRADNIKYAKGSSLEKEDKESMILSIELIKATKEADND